MKKIYTIEIEKVKNACRSGIWYANRAGQFYDAELRSKKDSEIVVFQVNPCQFVYQEDCRVVSERLVETYKPK